MATAPFLSAFSIPISSPKSSLFPKKSSHRLSLSSSVPRSLRSRLRSSWQPPVYVYPDPIPEFADAETQNFKDELRRKLLNSIEDFGDDIDDVVTVCAEIFSKFLHTEYGGPGTLEVKPFTDMLLALREKKLPGAPVAARAAILWAQKNVDHDWEIWTSKCQQSKAKGHKNLLHKDEDT